MKKTILFVLIMLCLLVFAGCNSSPSSNEQTGTDESPEVENITLKLGTIRDDSDPTTLAAHRFAEIVEENSAGAIKVDIYPNSTIGGILDMFTGMETGTVDMMYEGISSYPWLDGARDFNITSFPFFWESYDDLVKVLDSEDFQPLFEEAAAATGVRVIKAIGDTEARQLTANKAVHSAEDFNGLKIRTAESEIVQQTMQALGAQPVVIPLSDLYMALRQGTADAQENGFITVQNMSFYEVQDYVMQTDYIRDVKAWYISENLWSTLSDEQKGILTEASIEAGNYQTELAREQVEESLNLLKDEMEYIEPDLASIRATLEPTFQSFDGELWQEGLLEKVQTILNQ
ncbi:TRAP transporter substrate-binding protein [Halalkalibacter oceani]|uniref:TRAP transporter substrate-binding protein n=1 Tax=Halalkalibacter oceani TaxID=1653776 RepID=A0A9X2DSJ0_9BACI|nr:TRAP transporter substrate-binding protein [Halalkalibacter oceani]MCM3714775.1 TRAP transporter substrate-binding protein [Halalkalibacter oceani]